MKIGFLLNNYSYGGGAEIVTKRLQEFFIQHNYQSLIFSVAGTDVNEYIYSFNILNNKLGEIEITTIVEKIQQCKITNLIIQLTNPFSQIANIKLYKLLQEKKIKLHLVIHNSPCYFIKRYKDARDFFPKYLLKKAKTFFIYKKKAIRFFRTCESLGITLVTLSKGNRNELKKYYNVNSIVIPNYYKMKQYSDSHINEKKKTIAFIGRIDYVQKNILLLLDAWKLVRDKTDWKLYLIGSGDKSLLNEYIKKKRISSVLIERSYTAEEVESFLKKNSILVLTSKYEGYPTVLLEAMSYGNALICTKFDGYSDEVIKDNVNGFVTSFSAKEIANKIQQIINDDQLRKDMQYKSLMIRENFEQFDYLELWQTVF